jgi:subtilisin family serine protease
VISVGAISKCGERVTPDSCQYNHSWGSNYGDNLCVVAPGEDIPTTYLNGGYMLPSEGNGFHGTSAACPHVAGVAALMLSVNPNLKYTQVKAIIEKTAKKIGNRYNYHIDNSHPYGTWCRYMGYGLVDAGAAVQMAYDLRNVGDLYIKDENTDIGNEQNLMVVGYNAPEIRIIKDGRDVNTINAGEQYEVQIIVRNCSNISTLAGKKSPSELVACYQLHAME